MLFLLNLSRCVKSYGHLCQIYQNYSPNMVMSRDPGSVLNFKKSYQIWGSWLKKKVGKKQVGVNPPRSAYWVKCHHFTCRHLNGI